MCQMFGVEKKSRKSSVKYNWKANGIQGAKDFISNSKVRAMASTSVRWYPRKAEKRPSFKLPSWKTVSPLVNSSVNNLFKPFQ